MEVIKSFKQRGIGLLELMLSLAIIAILLILATRYYQSTSQSQKVNQAAGDIQALIAAVANVRAGNPNGNVTDTDITAFIPPSWGGSMSNANPWGGAYTVNSPGTAPYFVTVTVGGMGNTACQALASLMQSNMATPSTYNSASVCSGTNFSAVLGVNPSS